MTTAETHTRIAIEHPIKLRPDMRKEQMTYHESSKRLMAKGYENHILPNTAMQLINDYWQGIRTQHDPAIIQMILHGGEFFGMALEVNATNAITYEHPQNLILEGYQYTTRGTKLNHQGAQLHDIGTLPRNTKIPQRDLQKYAPTLADLLWPHQQLEGAYLILPTDGNLWPLARAEDDMSFGIVPTLKSGSRGIRTKRHKTVPISAVTHAPYEYAGMTLAANTRSN